MKIELDTRYVDDQHLKCFFAIRLYPETNEEMAKMEWGSKLLRVKGMERIDYPDQIHYAVLFEEVKKD